MKSVVYAATDLMELCEEDVNFMSQFLPPSRLEKAERYRREQDRRACIAAYFLLLYGLRENSVTEHIPEISNGPCGKPFFTAKDLCFNITHCSSAVCCGLSENDIGVDAEDTVTEFGDLADGVLSEREKAETELSSQPEILFTRFWTLKESYLKFLGTGIGNGLTSADFSGTDSESFERYGCRFFSRCSNGWRLSVCTLADLPDIYIRPAASYIREMKEKA